jgi:outer membrane protein TolC
MDAYESLQTNDRVVQLYRSDYKSGYLDVSKKSPDISEYAYGRGGVSLLDFLDTERSYRSTQHNATASSLTGRWIPPSLPRSASTCLTV